MNYENFKGWKGRKSYLQWEADEGHGYGLMCHVTVWMTSKYSSVTICFDAWNSFNAYWQYCNSARVSVHTWTLLYHLNSFMCNTNFFWLLNEAIFYGGSNCMQWGSIFSRHSIIQFQWIHDSHTLSWTYIVAQRTTCNETRNISKCVEYYIPKEWLGPSVPAQFVSQVSWLNSTRQRRKFSYVSWYFSALRT